MSGNERKRQKREDQEEARRTSGDASDNVAKSENTAPSATKSHPLPKLPAVVWGKHIAPFLHRKDLNNLLAQGGREIYEACQNLKFPWPTVELRLPELHLPVFEVDRDASSEMLRAISPDSKWVIAGQVSSTGDAPDTMEYHWTGLFVFHSRYGRAKDVVPLPGRPSSSPPRDFQETFSRETGLPLNRYYPRQISLSKDGQYLAVSYKEKLEVDVFRITFHEESETPSVSLELYRTFELDTETATSPFNPIEYSCHFVLSTNSKWLIVGFKGYYAGPFAVVAWDIETGSITKSEVGNETLHPSHDEIVATDSMILWRQKTGGRPFVIRGWTIENDELSSEEEPIHWSYPDNDVARGKLYCFRKLTPSPVDPSTFIVLAEETQEPTDRRHPIDMLKLIPSTEQEVSTKVQKLRRLVQGTSPSYASMNIGLYPDGQHLLLYDHRNRRFDIKRIAMENAHCATASIRREEMVDKANFISQWGMQAVDQARVQDFELSPDGEFLTVLLRHGYVDCPGQRLFVVSHNCGNTPDEIKRRL